MSSYLHQHKRDFLADPRLLPNAAIAGVIGAISTLTAWVLLNLIKLFTSPGHLRFILRPTITWVRG